MVAVVQGSSTDSTSADAADDLFGLNMSPAAVESRSGRGKDSSAAAIAEAVADHHSRKSSEDSVGAGIALPGCDTSFEV